MKKEFLHIFSFVMIAIFTFFCIGAVSAEETFDIPVIEEVSEEELAEVLPEEEDVEMMEEETEIAEGDAYFEILDGDGNHVWFFADLKEALNSAKLQNGYTLMMLKDYTWDNTSADTSKGESTGIKIPGKTFTWNGGGFTITDNFNKANFTPAGGKKGDHDNTASYALVSTNSKITIENITFSGNAQNTATSQGHTYGCLSVGNGTLTLKNVDIKNYQGWNGCAVWGQGGGKLLILEDVNIENCKARSHGIIGVYSITAEINGLTVKNSSGIAVGVGTAGHGGKLTISNSNITSCTTGIVAGYSEKTNNTFTATIGDNVTISNCNTGISAYPGKEVNITGSNVNVKENLKNGIYIASLTSKDTGDLIGAVVNVTGSLNVTGNKSNGIYIAGNSLLKLNGTVNITENTAGEIGMVSPDSVEVGADFAGTAGVTVSGNEIWFGHLAEGVETLNGTIYEGIDPNGHKGAVYESLMGSGTVTHNGKTYSLKKSFADTDNYDIPAKGVVFDYPLYIRTGTEDTGFKRVAFETFKEAYNLGSTGETIYLLKDLNDNDGVSLNATTTPTGGEAVLSHFDFKKSLNINGNGHKITKENSVAKYLFAVYSNAHFNVKNIVYDGSGLGAFAYINAHGGGGTISVDNCLVYNGLGGNAGAFYTLITDSASTSAAVINIKDTTIASCSAPNGGAIYAYYRSTINLENVEITDCSTESATTGNGGAVYIASGSKLNLKGRINISDNKKGTSENNIYLPGTNQITITGDISEGSLIGLSMAQSGATFGTVADGVDVDKTMFFADGAVIRNYTSVGVYTERKINAAFYPETVGDGKLNERVVIDVNDINEKKNSRTNELVLHWPWLLEKGGKLYGYADLLTAYSNANASDAVLYCQKDITIEHLWGKAIDDKNDFSSISKMTEFTMNGVVSNYAHTDMQRYLTLDGNGHVIDVDKKDSNAVFSLQWGNKNLTLNNFIYDGQKPFAVVHKSEAEGTETITVNNSYMTTVDDYPLFTVGKGGTINIIDSTLEGKIQMEGVAEDTANSKPEYRSKFNLYGNASVKGLGINIGNAYVDGCIDKTYTGNSVVGGDVSQLKAGEGFTALESVSSITKAGSNGETFAYYDEANNKFAWTMTPELTLTTDSGKYSDGFGTIRFLTTFKSVAPDAVASYGTYAVGASSFDENAQWQSNQFREFDKTPGADKVYYVDAVKIPAEHFDTEIAALSFVKIKGIKTPIYYDFNLASVNKNDTETGDGVLKNLGDPTYTEA